MIPYIEEIELSENKRSFVIKNIKVSGESLLEKAKNKNLAFSFIKNIKKLKVRGKSNQFAEYIKLQEYGIKIKFPPQYQREIILSDLFD